MPNRVDAAGLRPTATRPDAQQAAQRTPEPAQEAPQQTDRVEISDQARLRAEQARPQAGANSRGAAANAPSARAPEAGEQGSVNGTTAQQAEQVRAAQAEAAQETAQTPPERQGNLVDVVG